LLLSSAIVDPFRMHLASRRHCPDISCSARRQSPIHAPRPRLRRSCAWLHGFSKFFSRRGPLPPVPHDACARICRPSREPDRPAIEPMKPAFRRSG
jgi:hypothetical protein